MDKKTEKEILAYRISLVILCVGLAACGYQLHKARSVISPLFKDASETNTSLPYYKEIREIISPLQYSGLPDLLRPTVTLSIDFNRKEWTLHNLHQYDANGDILLDEGRYGLCGELSTFVSKAIKPLLKDRYDIKYIKAAESGYFLEPYATHIVLMISDKINKDAFFLDPSFHKYGKKEDFEDCLFYNEIDLPSILNNKSKDIFFPVDYGMPLLIRKNTLLYFTVESVDGNLDKNNFLLAVTATQRYKYSGRYVFSIRKQRGKKQKVENTWLQEQLLTPEETAAITNKIVIWFKQIEAS